MPKKAEKRAFVFNASYLNVIEEFPEDRRGKLAIAIIDYGLSDSFNGDSIMLMALQPEE